jgi:hypothetical protein
MIDVKSKDRLIGDVIEVNGDIVAQEYNSKLPKPIKKIYYNRYRKKLLKSIDKLVSSNHILTTDNLIEFFTVTFNNFPPDGRFNSIIRSVRDDVLNHCIEAVIKFDEYEYLITIDRLDYPNFRLICRRHIDEYTTDGINITTNKLFSANPKKSDYLEKINRQILKEIGEYLRSNVASYDRKE